MVRFARACAALLVALGMFAAPACSAANNYPVILVHGFLGFGPEEFQHSGFNYWGGYGDIASQMQIYRGPRAVFAAAVGPISSNWDRAADLYAQIKCATTACRARCKSRPANAGPPTRATTRKTIRWPCTRPGTRTIRST